MSSGRDVFPSRLRGGARGLEDAEGAAGPVEKRIERLPPSAGGRPGGPGGRPVKQARQQRKGRRPEPPVRMRP